MNILMIVNELRYTCGVTNHLLHLSEGLANTGDVKLWIICGGGNGVHRFRDTDVTIITDERFLHSNRNFSGFISAINYLVRFTRSNKIDIVHSHSHYGAAIAGRASMFTGKPTIQTNHGILADEGKLKHFNADKYAAINSHIKKHIIDNKIADEKDVYFIRCGIPLPDKMPIKNSTDKIKILAASRFTEDKGLDIYIHAVNKLPDEIIKRSVFYIAGEGEKEDRLTELNRELGSKINFAGRIKDMYSFLENTHILVNPSRSLSEGFPAIITEAGALNTLVISSDFTGAEDVLINGENCLIYKDNSSDNLSKLLSMAIGNYENYTHLANNFFRFVSGEFSVEMMIDKHLNMYRSAIK